jgi:hypothetical protein
VTEAANPQQTAASRDRMTSTALQHNRILLFHLDSFTRFCYVYSIPRKDACVIHLEHYFVSS